jgi:uncharacterized protein YndB with AHSA1/START domain
VSRLVNSVTIAGAMEAVFDLVTSARFWPRWHPATRAVGGVTERPFRLGDRVYERAQIGPSLHDVTWIVTEHERPTRAVLQAAAAPVEISYTFQARGDATWFERALDYNIPLALTGVADQSQFDRIMHEHSGQALGRLKELVEQILRDEAAGLS